MDHDDAGLRLPAGRAAGANAGPRGHNPGGKPGKGARRPGRKNSQRKPGKTRRK
jgi:hypothetical protein